MAAAGGGDRGQYRGRLSTLQQILQLLLFGTGSVRVAGNDVFIEHREPAAGSPSPRRGEGRGEGEMMLMEHSAPLTRRPSVADPGSSRGQALSPTGRGEAG